MKILDQKENKIVVEFDLFDFDSLQDFFKEQKEAVDSTGKFNYEAIQKLLGLKFKSSTFVNDMRLKKIKHIFNENERQLAKNKAKK